MHLRAVNPHVAGALDDWTRNSLNRPSVPRQSHGAVTAAAMPVAGTSAFGMSGVNAHMLLSAPFEPRTPVKVWNELRADIGIPQICI